MTDFSTLGERLPAGDPRGPIAYRHLGIHQDRYDSRLEADRSNQVVRRTATDLEVALLRHVAMLPAEDVDHPDNRTVTTAIHWYGPVAGYTFAAGRQLLIDTRLTTEDTATHD
ncbi:hypothetical protein DFR67_103165 [Williamsia limnetica]|uniref:Uncharacterized protein n=1 Tax=Williamsia limnetica TaxID=882452 RepID=A0A318RQR2_WILLI|nr:hypothetical protein [Williamsia limnetica]PYE19254.1 hypothetical protein DFR67_103165 [Williamsia limnetica]